MHNFKKQLFALQAMLLLLGYTAFGQNVNLGANVNGYTDYTRDRLFNDVFKGNRGLSADTNAPWNYIAPSTDANGWPTQDFATIVMVGMEPSMGGTYKMRFLGQATIGGIVSGFTVQNQVYNATTNTTTADLVYPAVVSPTEQMMIKFTNTNFGGGVAGIKNVEIMVPGVAFGGARFGSKIMSQLQRFSTIRYMDLHSTNNNTDSLWNNRTKPTSPSQASNNGVAWEYLIEMANTLNKDMWINIPHKANDNYVTNLANLIKNTLNPNLKVYVEYSNEVWNWQFEQAAWTRDMGVYYGNLGGHPINYDNVNENNTFHFRYVAYRTKQISDVFKNVFGAPAINNRIRVVHGVQFGWFDYTRRGLEFIDKYYGSPSQYFYGITIAPYFNAFTTDGTVASTQDVLNALNADVNNMFDADDNWVDAWQARATYYGMKMICYEGGPDTFGPENIASKRNAQFDPQMKTITQSYLNKWYAYNKGEGLFNWFTAGAGDYNSQYGTWSVTENWENSQKLQGLDAMLAAPAPALTAGRSIPNDVEAEKYAGYFVADAASGYYQQPGWDDSPKEYLLNVSTAGYYSIFAKTATFDAGQSFKLYIDHQLVGIMTVPNNGSNTNFVNTNTITMGFALRAGLHSMRYEATTNDYRIDKFTMALAAPLAVSFMEINAKKVGNGSVLVQWTVQNIDTSTDKFEIQRSNEQQNWEMIGGVKCVANGAGSINSYEFLDEKPAFVSNFYRIKAVDFDGRYEYSKIVEIKLDNTIRFSVENPVKDYLNLVFEQPAPTNTPLNVVISDVLGKEVLAREILGGSNISLDVSHLTKGIYVLKITDAANENAKMVKLVKE